MTRYDLTGDQMRAMVECDEQKLRDALCALLRERDEARDALHRFARDISTNYDHDADAHRHGYADSQCRVCKAEALLAAARQSSPAPEVAP